MTLIDQDKLIQELQPVTAWPELGYLLGIDKSTIEDIKKENADNGQSKIKLMKYWAVKYPNGTMRDIIRAVEKVGNTDLAARLKNKYRGTEDDHKGGARLTRFCNLEKKFTLLVVHAKEGFQDDEFEKVKSQLKNTFTESESHLSFLVSYDQLFSFLRQNHLNVFNTYALKVVANFLPQKFIDEYQLFLDAQQDFYRSISVYQFEEACFCHCECKCSNDMEALEIKLSIAKAKAISMEQVQDLLRSILGEKIRYLGRVVATRGSISVSWLISQPLVLQFRKTAESQNYPEWINRVQIGSFVVFSKANEDPEEDQEEDQHSIKELKRQLKESADQIKGDAVQLERHKEQISQLKIEMERLTKEPSDPILEMMQQWTHLKDKFDDAKHMYSVIGQQPKHPKAHFANKIYKVLKQPRPLIFIPVTGPKENGKTVLLNAMIGGSIVHKKKAFPVYVEHVPERHLYCEAAESPCDLCARLVTSNGDVLAIGRHDVLHIQEIMKVPKKGEYYVIQTKILMLDKFPNDFPFTVYLADCPANNIAQIDYDFALSALLVPAVVCAVSTKKYMQEPNATLKSAQQALVVTSMVNQGLSEAQVVFAATFCDEVYDGGDRMKSLVPRMKDDLGSLSTNPYDYYAVAGKWALKAREYIEDPHKEGIDEHMKAAWKWVQTEQNVPKWINPDKIVELAISYFEESIKQSITNIKVKQWVGRLYDHSHSNMHHDDV